MFAVEQARCLFNDARRIIADELDAARLDRLGSLGLVTQHEHGFIEAGRFFLQPPESVRTR